VDSDDLLSDLVESLDRDLELLLTLRYRLIVLGALAAADQSPSIVTAVREIEIAYEAIRVEELVRSAATMVVLDHFELDPASHLDELADVVGGGWGEVLLDRRRNLIEIVTGIQSLANTVSAAMGRRAALADEALTFLRTDAGTTYGRSASRGGVLVDGSL
jgi:hypothetical protein